MSSTRRRAATIATTVALGALGGVALASNHGLPPGAAGPTAGRASGAPIVTSTSGATQPAGATQSTPAAAGARSVAAPQIVTRASGAPALAEREEE